MRAPASSETVESHFPPIWKPDESEVLPNGAPRIQVSKKINQLGIKLNVPRAIPELVKVDSLLLIDKALQPLLEIEGSRLKKTIQYPLGDNRSTEWLPKYTVFDWYVEPYDKPLLKQIMYDYYESTGFDPTSQDHFLTLLWDAARDRAYGNGSLLGQITRISTMYDVKTGRDTYHAAKPIVDLYKAQRHESAIEIPARMLEKYLPIGSVEALTDEGGWPGLFTRVSSFLHIGEEEGEEDYDWLPPISDKSASGVPYQGKTKGETVTEALAIADQFLIGLSAIIKKQISGIPEANDAKQATVELKELLQEYWYLGCGSLFPKGERYEKKKWFTKTRNIWSAPFPTHLLMSLVSWPVMKTSPNAVTFDTPSLYAFSPFHGGLDIILAKALRPGHQTFVYADNYYIAYEEADHTKTWFSLDLVRGEAETTIKDGQLLAYYLLTRGHVTEDGKPAFSATWAYLALYILPTLCIDSTGLIGNLQLQIPGQGSGNSWTFLLNHIKVSAFDDKWKKLKAPRPGSKEFGDIQQMCGVNLTIETELTDLMGRMNKARDSTVDDGYFGMLMTDKPPSKPPTEIKLDLLGWSAVWAPCLEKFIPVLDSKRLADSVSLPKGLGKAAKDISGTLTRFYNVARFEASRLVGGWQYAPVDLSLRRRADEERKQIIKRGFGRMGKEDYWKQALEKTEMAEVLKGEGLNLQMMVTGQDLRKLHMGSQRMTETASMAMDMRQRFEAGRVQTRGEMKANPAGSYVTWNFFKKIGKLTVMTDPGEMDEKKLNAVVMDAWEEIMKVKEMLEFAGEHTLPSTRPKRVQPDAAADPRAHYRIHPTPFKGEMRSHAGFGPSRPANFVPEKTERSKVLQQARQPGPSYAAPSKSKRKKERRKANKTKMQALEEEYYDDDDEDYYEENY